MSVVRFILESGPVWTGTYGRGIAYLQSEAAMPRVPNNPDRDVSADEIDNLDVDTLRSLLERSDPADLLDAATRERIGRAIARTAETPPPQSSVPQQQRQRTDPDQSDKE